MVLLSFHEGLERFTHIILPLLPAATSGCRRIHVRAYPDAHGLVRACQVPFLLRVYVLYAGHFADVAGLWFRLLESLVMSVFGISLISGAGVAPWSGSGAANRGFIRTFFRNL